MKKKTEKRFVSVLLCYLTLERSSTDIHNDEINLRDKSHEMSESGRLKNFKRILYLTGLGYSYVRSLR